MDSDFTADSLSSAEFGGASTREQGSGFGSMLSFSTQGPSDQASSKPPTSAILDSFDLSPATDASSAGGFLDMENQQQRSNLPLPGAERPGTLSEARRNPNILSREGDEENADDDSPSYSDINFGGSVEMGVPKTMGDGDVVGVAPVEAGGGGGGGGPRRIRKRSREAAMTGEPVSSGRQPSQQSLLDRLETTWPLVRKGNSDGEGSRWDNSQPSLSPSFSQQCEVISPFPREHASMTQRSRSTYQAAKAVVDGAMLNGLSRHGKNDGGERNRRGSQSENDRDYSGDFNSNREGMSVSSSEALLSGGIAETFSFISEVSSRGLPAPPLIPSGPLPAIGAIREYFLTEPQKNRLDYERRLTADHLRRLNQVLAGHLSYLEVSKIHTDRENVQTLAAAPSHGSAVGFSASLDGLEEERGITDHALVRENTLRRLVLRAVRERTRGALTRAWVRMWRFSTWATANSSAVAKPMASDSGGWVTNKIQGNMGVHQDLEGNRKYDVVDRQQQGMKLLDRVCQNQNNRLVFRGWSRLCLYAASISAAEGVSAAATAAARAARAEAMEKEAQAAADKAEAWKRAAAASVEVAEAREKAQRLPTVVSMLTDESNRKGEDIEQASREQQLRRLKVLITRVCGEIDRTLMFRGWSRLCLHAVSISSAEGASAAATALARAARAEAMEKEAQSAADRAEAWRRAAAASDELAEARKTAQGEVSRVSTLAAELSKSKADMERFVREQRLRQLKMLITRVCGAKDRALVFRGWNRLCLHAASLSAAEGESAAASAFARATRAEAMEKEAKAAAASAEMTIAREEEEQKTERTLMLVAQSKRREQDVTHVALRVKTMISRVCQEKDKRLLFRGWSRLCMHAASINATNASFAAVTVKGRGARDETESTEAASVVASANIVTNDSQTRQSQQAVEGASREQTQEADEINNRVFAAGEQNIPQDDVAKLSAQAAALKERAEDAERAFKHQKRLEGVRMMSRVENESRRRLLFRGWSRLCLHTASLNATGASAAAEAATRVVKEETEEIRARPEISVVHDQKNDVSKEWNRPEQELRRRRAKIAITRACIGKERISLFRGWSRLCLYTVSRSTSDGVPAAANAVERAERAQPFVKERGADSNLPRTRTGAIAAIDGGSQPSAVSAALQRAQKVEDNMRKQGALLVVRILAHKNARLLLRGWCRFFMHAATFNITEGALAHALPAAGSRHIGELKGEVAPAERLGEFTTRKGLAAAKEKDQKKSAEDVSSAPTDLEQLQTHWEKAAREQQLRRVKMLIIRVSNARDRNLLFRGWNRMCLHVASISAAEGASATAKTSAKTFAAETAEREKAVAVEVVESPTEADATKGYASIPAMGNSALGPGCISEQEQQRRRAKMLIKRLFLDATKVLLFRGWNRLCVHAASLSAAEGAAAAATAVATAARAEATQVKTAAVNNQSDGFKKTTDASAEEALIWGHATSGEIVASTDGAEIADQVMTLKRTLRLEQERRAGMLVARVCGERDRSLMFRGWNRLYRHAASLSAADPTSTVASSIIGTRAKQKETEVEAAANKVGDWRTQAADSEDVVGVGEKLERETGRGVSLAAELKLKERDMENMVRGHQLRCLKTLVVRRCGERDRTLIFRGWSRLCLHAASISAAEGVSAAATAVARAARAEAMEKEAQAAADKAEAWKRAAAASIEVAEAKEKAQQGVSQGLVLPAALRRKCENAEQALREQQLRRVKMSITRVCGERDRTLMFRGWSRLCLHAVSISSAEGASAAATALARAARAEAMEKEAQSAADKAEEESKEEQQQVAAYGSIRTERLNRRVGDTVQVEREQRLRRFKMLIIRICGAMDQASIFRGWSRLCLHAASLSAAEIASADAIAVAEGARAEAMQMKAEAVAAKAEMVAMREEAQRVTPHGSLSWTEPKQRLENMKDAKQAHQLYRMKMLVIRVCGERDRALMSRGWSRLCLYAASVSVSNEASTTAIAVARAARAEAIEKDAQAAADKAGLWRRAVAASIRATTVQERTQCVTCKASKMMLGLRRKDSNNDRVERERQLRQAMRLMIRVCGERDRALMFRGWSRLCLHAASISAAEGASAAATAVARAARAEAMEKEAQAAADKAEAWQRAATASAEVAGAREKARRETIRGSILAAELRKRKDELEQVTREQRLRRTRMLITRVCGERDRALMFRGWSRLCLHAASISAAEGASAAATAVARAARAEAMEKEAQAAADKAEAWQTAAAASAEVAGAREKARRETIRGSILAAELRKRKDELEQVTREQRLRGLKVLISRVCGDRDRALVFRGWCRLCRHAASLSAAEGERASRAEVTSEETQTAVPNEQVAAREGAQWATGGERISATDSKNLEDTQQREQQLRQTKCLVARLCRKKERALMFRGWSRLCLHAASLNAAERASASATAVARASRAEALEKQAAAAADATAEQMKGVELIRRRARAIQMCQQFVQRTERQTVARGWARLRAAVAVPANAAAFAEDSKKMAVMEAYVIDLQRQAARRGRELDRKTRALAILLRGDWANTALEREKETRAARLQLAEAEANLAWHIDSMADLAVANNRSNSSGGRALHGLEVSGHPRSMFDGRVAGTEGGGLGTAGEEAEVFLGGVGGSVGMVALQGEGARRVRAYVAGKGRDLKRAKVESQQWRARCEALQRRWNNKLNSERQTGCATSSLEGNRLAAILLHMLDDRDHRLSRLYKDLASLSIDDCGNDFPTLNRKEGGRRGKSRKLAADFLLKQMIAAGNEARSHVYRLSHEVQRLQAVLDSHSATALASEPPGSDYGKRLPANSASSLKDRTHGLRGAFPFESESAERAETGVQGGTDGYTPGLLDDYCVLAAIDAHELILSLRSEVSALERHSACLQRDLERLEDQSATQINQAAAAAAWTASTAAAASANERGGGEVPRMTDDGGANTEKTGAAATAELTLPKVGRGKKARAERKRHAAEVLRNTLHDCNGSGDGSAAPSGASETAGAAGLAREARQRAQVTFVSRRSIAQAL